MDFWGKTETEYMRDFYARGRFNGFKQFLNLPDVFLGLQTRLGQELGTKYATSEEVIKVSQKGPKSRATGPKGVQITVFSKNHSEAQGSREKVYNCKINPYNYKIHPHNSKINP